MELVINFYLGYHFDPWPFPFNFHPLPLGSFGNMGLSDIKVVGDSFSPFFYGLGIPLLSRHQYPAGWKLVQDPLGEPCKPFCGH